MVAPQLTTWSMQMFKVFAFLKNESGATTIEYGLTAAGISALIIAAVNSIGSTIFNLFDTFAKDLKAAAP